MCSIRPDAIVRGERGGDGKGKYKVAVTVRDRERMREEKGVETMGGYEGELR